MISVIVCSVNPALLSRLTGNIGQTIGVPFEMLAFDNRNPGKGICAVYNRQGKEAKYPFLCFVHEDILFGTKDWGNKVIRHLQEKSTGLIGVAGGDAKSRVPTSWSTVFRSQEVNVWQSDKQGSPPQHIRLSAGNVQEQATDAVCLDGLFLCTRKEVFDEFRFDEERLTGFHGYDIDYSLQVLTRYRVKVVSDIEMTHYSAGNVNKAWMESAVAIARKWNRQLPVSVYRWSREERDLYHWQSMQVFLQNLFLLHYPYLEILLCYIRYSFSGSFSARRFLSMGRYIAGCMTGKDPLRKPVTIPAAGHPHLSIKTDV